MMDSLPDNLAIAYPSPEGSDSSPAKSTSSGEGTPRKNKRKMTEPKKRGDFSIKRFCPDSPVRHEYPPDTPETSPSPEANKSGIPEATPQKDLTALRAYPLNVPSLVSLPVTPPITPGRTSSEPERISSSTTSSSPSGVAPFTSSSTSLQPTVESVSASTRPMVVPPSPSSSESNCTPQKGGGGRRQRKNYKNMTRERRVEANARERTRVHTISAAFETLRRAVPSYSYNQRLSKLAILKIACSYIMSLGQLTDKDYTPGKGDNPGFAQCVERCTQTIQAEGRTKRRH